jgi:hypothetical protein
MHIIYSQMDENINTKVKQARNWKRKLPFISNHNPRICLEKLRNVMTSLIRVASNMQRIRTLYLTNKIHSIRLHCYTDLKVTKLYRIMKAKKKFQRILNHGIQFHTPTTFTRKTNTLYRLNTRQSESGGGCDWINTRLWSDTPTGMSCMNTSYDPVTGNGKQDCSSRSALRMSLVYPPVTCIRADRSGRAV